MKAFGPYVSHLEELLVTSMWAPGPAELRRNVKAALDGQPSTELRRLVSLSRLRKAGAFFTGSRLARRTILAGLPKVISDITLLDPACGVGDLLVAFLSYLPCSSELESTLSDWSARVLALDVRPEFVRATKLRLALAAVRRHTQIRPFRLQNFDRLFSGVCVGSSLSGHKFYGRASHIVINPPFTSVDAPKECQWGEGKVNSAAVFMDACIANAEPGTRVIAILPDVLRSGSRYAKWRKLFEQRVLLRKLEILGQFDRHTDVDVFMAVGDVRKEPNKTRRFPWVPCKGAHETRIKDKFDISVGAVVPFRDPHRGAWYPFIQARDLPSWQSVFVHSNHRRFKGKTFEPPFVVVRRTSRPGVKNRAVATVVHGSRQIAVENHLIVLRPKDESVNACKQLMRQLKEERTTELLDHRIRCRHLTISSLGDLPWRDK